VFQGFIASPGPDRGPFAPTCVCTPTPDQHAGFSFVIRGFSPGNPASWVGRHTFGGYANPRHRVVGSPKWTLTPCDPLQTPAWHTLVRDPPSNSLRLLEQCLGPRSVRSVTPHPRSVFRTRSVAHSSGQVRCSARCFRGGLPTFLPPSEEPRFGRPSLYAKGCGAEQSREGEPKKLLPLLLVCSLFHKRTTTQRQGSGPLACSRGVTTPLLAGRPSGTPDRLGCAAHQHTTSCGFPPGACHLPGIPHSFPIPRSL